MTTATTKEKVTVDSTRKLKWILPICMALAALLFITGASSYTSQTDFCRSCHEMEGVFATWESSAHGKNELGIVAECQDCHLPGGFAQMLVTKVGKLKEPYVHYIVRPSAFEFQQKTPALKVRARKGISDDNCLACHDLTQQLPKNQVQQIAHSTAVGTASCVSCHKRTGHRPQSNN
ncbi:MAG: hypothetical protein GX262_04115 [Clostridia bacterium]|nr:hypothetical protein [Clostridia bacterium]